MRNIKGYCQMLTESRAQRALDDALIEDIVAGDIEGCRDLLSHGASPDAKNTKSLEKPGVYFTELSRKGYSALQVAILHHNLDIVKLLLDQGASVDHIAPSGWTTLGIALEKIRTQHVEASSDQVDMVKALVFNGASVTERFKVGNWTDVTALHIVISTSAREIIRFLIDQGADTNAVAEYRDENGSVRTENGTPLGWILTYSEGRSPLRGLVLNATELIMNGANPFLENKRPERWVEFFEGDVSWMPDAVRSKFEAISKTRSLFKR